MAKLKGGTRIYGSIIVDDQTLIGSATTTGTAGQSLQIAGINSGAYIGGRVGIGTTNPSVPLEVSGAVRATVYYGDGSNLTGIVASGGGSSGGTSLSISTSTSSSTNFLAFVSSAGTSILGITTAIGLTYVPSTSTLNVGIISIGSGIVTATTSSGIITYYGDGSKLTNVVTVGSAVTGTNIVGSAISISGISTFNTVRISTGIISATSGVVTYFGDGSRLTGIQTAGAAVAAGGTFTQIQFNDSGTLNGANFFTYDKGTARVGIGTSLPTSRLSVASTTTGASLMVVNDNLSDGTLFRVSDNSANVLMDIDANGTILFPTTGNVGIGTTLISPTSKLQVVGNVLVSGIVTATTFSGIFTGSHFGDGSRLSGILTSGSAGGSSGQVQFNVNGTPSGANFFNYDTGTARVGIGTSLPTARLSVASTTTGASLMVVNDNLSDGSLFRVTDNSANILMDVDANGTIVFNNSGNIGIGTTIVTPTSKLQVTGDALVSGVVTATTFSGNHTGTAITVTTGIITNIVGVAATISTVRILSGIITATSGIITYYGSGAFLTGIVTSGAAGQGAAGQIQFNDSGPLAGSGFFHYDKGTARVGIGTSLPTARLSVASTTTGASLMVVNDNLSDGSLFRVTDNSANILMDIDANGTIVFNNSGNVGIGTTLTSPTSKLQVTGDVLVSGVITATTYNGQVNAGVGTITTIIGTGASITNINSTGIITARTELDVGIGGTFATITSIGLGIGTANPTAKLQVVGASNTSLLLVNDNLSDGSLFRVNDSIANVLMDVDANGTIVFPTTGNIGIGTTLFTPTSKLQVVGNVLISGIVTAGTLQISSGIVTATSGVVTYFGDGSRLTGISASGGVSISTNTTNQAQYLTYVTGTGSTTGFGVTTTGLVFNPSRNTLGIGTTNPTSTLTVTGNALVSGISTFAGIATYTASLFGTQASFTGIVTANSYRGDGSQLTGISAGVSISTNTTNQFQYIPYVTGTGSTTGFGVTTAGLVFNPSTGNLGIGTTNALQKLHVLGNLLVAAGSSTGQHITQKAYQLNSGTLSWEGTAGQLFSITNNLTSGSIFSVNDVSGIPSIDVNATGTVSMVAYGGNLGVGSTNPTSKLTVVGNALITGITTVGLGTTSTPPSNSQLSFELTSNTNLVIKVRGTDGVLRTANITLG